MTGTDLSVVFQCKAALQREQKSNFLADFYVRNILKSFHKKNVPHLSFKQQKQKNLEFEWIWGFPKSHALKKALWIWEKVLPSTPPIPGNLMMSGYLVARMADISAQVRNGSDFCT